MSAEGDGTRFTLSASWEFLQCVKLNVYSLKDRTLSVLSVGEIKLNGFFWLIF